MKYLEHYKGQILTLFTIAHKRGRPQDFKYLMELLSDNAAADALEQAVNDTLSPEQMLSRADALIKRATATLAENTE